MKLKAAKDSLPIPTHRVEVREPTDRPLVLDPETGDVLKAATIVIEAHDAQSADEAAKLQNKLAKSFQDCTVVVTELDDPLIEE